MSKKLKFVIACEVIDNVRLMQPHGMIPYTLYKHYGYDAEVVTYKNGEYSYLDNELKGLKIRFLRHFFSKKFKPPFFWYLARNAGKIDVLMVYNVKKRPIYYGLIYKLFNPRGFLYVKADTALPAFNFYVENAFFPYKYYMRTLGKLFLKKCNAVSFESSLPYQHNKQVSEDKKLLIPCGFDPDIVKGLSVQERTFAEKENIVLHVARMGSHQKNTEHLVRSIAKMQLPDDWRFIFIGSQTNGFHHFREAFVREHPELEERMEFHEHIQSKAELYNFYSRARIFCLPSRIESFGNVLVEALYFGNAIAATETIPSVQDLVDEGRNGVMFSIKNDNDLAQKLEQLMQDSEKLESMSVCARDYAEKHLNWKNALQPLHEKIQRHYAHIN
ncbi:glycosyltransferase [Thiohalophilus sp.]|uniref:glycosyltransferase family 4 protein n=1 Tax=Thiohalophilus sp. TaxID=3028392 RepID=UPI002ACD2F07|nr:glycosyltransferase [Thiohalophilus sp.]MDZ7661024.1 glycosyltransferase [Thiohalophilus sp.]